jgi:hypothetical protein
MSKLMIKDLNEAQSMDHAAMSSVRAQSRVAKVGSSLTFQ